MDMYLAGREGVHEDEAREEDGEELPRGHDRREQQRACHHVTNMSGIVSKLSANCQHIISTMSAKKRGVCQTHSHAPNAHEIRAFHVRGEDREELPGGRHRRKKPVCQQNVSKMMSAK